MSRSRKLQLRISQMKEIRTILNSMKNLAFIEIHKLARFQTVQGQAVTHIENAAMDFLNFYPYVSSEDENSRRICLLIGSERGFCGDFNERLMISLATEDCSGIIAVGSRLYSRLKDDTPELIAKLEGANVTEEVPAILNQLVDLLGSLQQGQGSLVLTVIYHEAGRIARRRILPPFLQLKQTTPCYGHPPLLNLDPAGFFSELVHQYLFAVLHEIFYHSLMAENQSRQQHLDGAVRHLDEAAVKLNRKSQMIRQEEITEEIEVILLNSDNL